MADVADKLHTPPGDDDSLRFALPKGRMQGAVVELLAEAGIQLRLGARGYRPTLSVPGFTTKLLKPQNIAEMLAAGSRDVGITGADWVAELKLDLVELLDTRLDPVRIVAAAPRTMLIDGQLPQRPLIIASEYESLTRDWISRSGLNATFVRSFGATEVFPPEDADCIVDNTATGSTLEANGLQIIDEVMTSSTRLFANPRALDHPAKRQRIEWLVMLLKSVLAARGRVVLELNVAAPDLERVIELLPAMRDPTVAKLHHEAGYAVKAAIQRDILPTLIPQLKAAGGSDIIISDVSQIVP